MKLISAIAITLVSISVHANTVNKNCAGGYLKVTLDDQTIKAGSQAAPHYTYEYNAAYISGSSGRNMIQLDQWYNNSGITAYYIRDDSAVPYYGHIVMTNYTDTLRPVTINTPGNYFNQLHIRNAWRPDCDVNITSNTTVI